MDYVLRVRRFEGAANLQHDFCRLGGGEFASLPQESAEVLSLDEIHGDEFDPVGLPQVENANDVFVRDLASKNQFLLEASQHFRVASEFRANQFECDKPVEFLVSGLIDCTHAAASEKLKNFVASRQQCPRRQFVESGF